MNKTLYFEGAGLDSCKSEYNGINCRIRTAFHDNKNRMICLELWGCHPNKAQLQKAKLHNIELPNTYLYVDHVYYITDDLTIDDCDSNRIKTIPFEEMIKIPYTLENIKSFINKHFKSNFDEVVVLDDLAGYRVFTGINSNTSKKYNFGDCFDYDEELTEKRKKKVLELSEQFKRIFNQKYDNTSFYIENDALTVCINVPEDQRVKAGYIDRVFTVDV